RPEVGDSSMDDTQEQEAMIMLMSTYEPAEIKFDEFRAPVSGYYDLTFSGYTIWMSLDFKTVSQGRRTEPVTIYSETPPRRLRRLGAFDFEPDPTRHHMRVWLKRGESIQPDATRLVRSRPPDFENPFEEEDGMPGVAFQWMEVEGPFYDQWPEKGHQLLFGDLPIEDPAKETREGEGDRRKHLLDTLVYGPRPFVEVQSRNPAKDAAKLLKHFMEAAYRRPVPKDEYQRFLALIEDTLGKGFNFVDSMIAGYTAVLSSPAFIYLEPTAPELDGYALAERLSYFLWNSPPDTELLALAENGRIKNPYIKSQQVERLLSDPRSERFVEAFLDYWLDLRKMGDSGPDAELYPEYQLDDSLTESMPRETRLYFAELINQNLSVGHVVDSGFVFVNERLATLYDIPGVTGADIRKVVLPPESPRGGLMTQGSVLKVTANGTTSSPVIRGAWIMQRILGKEIPPPPPSVKAIESDIRGAKTIREQLALHRSQESCNKCHEKIDPAGFALESFDVMGGWRDRYRTTAKGQGEITSGVGHDGQDFRFKIGLPVDASGQLPDGTPFQDIRELKALLLQDEEQLARNL
ncbi:MAG: DUF1592 domain-containing protein, partial [Verrucomicrobiae bacterium]|nr:DUF1592 domain-containing protein [Verrucomicrobiae bacterium]